MTRVGLARLAERLAWTLATVTLAIKTGSHVNAPAQARDAAPDRLRRGTITL